MKGEHITRKTSAKGNKTAAFKKPWGIMVPSLLALLIFCLIFYGGLEHYAGTALPQVRTPAALERLMFLRVLFTLGFCLLLGGMGSKMTGALWPAPLLHILVAAFMLWQDMGKDALQDMDVSLGLLLGVALVTFLGGVAARFWSGRGGRRGKAA